MERGADTTAMFLQFFVLCMLANPEVKLKTEQVFDKNVDLKYLRAVNDQDVDTISTCSQFKKINPSDLTRLSTAPITSCEVERTFSVYKSILRDNRRSFQMESLKKHLTIASLR